MIPLQWKQQYAIEPNVIDPQHRHLLDLLNQAITGGDDPQELRSLNRALLFYARTHFRTEENLFSRFPDYREAEDHRQEHRAFWTEMTGLQFRISADPAAAHRELLTFLQQWLVKHITGTDQTLVPHLRHTAMLEDRPTLRPLEPLLGQARPEPFLAAFPPDEQQQIRASLWGEPEKLLYPFQKGELLWSAFLGHMSRCCGREMDAGTFWTLWEQSFTLKAVDTRTDPDPQSTVLLINTDPILWRRTLQPLLQQRGYHRFVLSFQAKARYPESSFLKTAQAIFPLGRLQEE